MTRKGVTDLLLAQVVSASQQSDAAVDGQHSDVRPGLRADGQRNWLLRSERVGVIEGHLHLATEKKNKHGG